MAKKQRMKTNGAVSRAAQVSAEREADLAEEYRYVITDLKRIAVLALAMLALLVVLAIVLI